MFAQSPLVSIIIPTYNCRQWVDQAIDSALAQTYQRCEIIVVDDGSTDGTGEMLTERYRNSILYHRQLHQGVASARNQALALAQGEYIQLLDADDLIRPEKVALHVDFLQRHPEVDVVYCDVCCFYEDNIDNLFPWWGRDLYASGDVFESMLDTGFTLTMATLIRRAAMERVGMFDETLESNEDWDCFLRLAYAGSRFYYLPSSEPLALYRLHRGSRSSRVVEHCHSAVRILERFKERVKNDSHRAHLSKPIRQAKGRWQFAYGKAIANNGYRVAGIREMVLSLLWDQRNLDYKLTYLLLYLVLGPGDHREIVELLASLKRRCGNLLSRMRKRITVPIK